MTQICVIRSLNKEISAIMKLICTPGHGRRLSEVNLYTLLSLWMEIFPQKQPEDTDHNKVMILMKVTLS